MIGWFIDWSLFVTCSCLDWSLRRVPRWRTRCAVFRRRREIYWRWGREDRTASWRFATGGAPPVRRGSTPRSWRGSGWSTTSAPGCGCTRNVQPSWRIGCDAGSWRRSCPTSRTRRRPSRWTRRTRTTSSKTIQRLGGGRWWCPGDSCRTRSCSPCAARRRTTADTREIQPSLRKTRTPPT